MDPESRSRARKSRIAWTKDQPIATLKDFGDAVWCNRLFIFRGKTICTQVLMNMTVCTIHMAVEDNELWTVKRP